MPSAAEPRFAFGIFDDAIRLVNAWRQLRLLPVPARTTAFLAAGNNQERAARDLILELNPTEATTRAAKQGKRPPGILAKYLELGPVPADYSIVTFRSPGAVAIGDRLRELGAVNVYVGLATYFRDAAISPGDLDPRFARIFADITAQAVARTQRRVTVRSVPKSPVISLAGGEDFGVDDTGEGESSGIRGGAIFNIRHYVNQVRGDESGGVSSGESGDGVSTGGGGGDADKPPKTQTGEGGGTGGGGGTGNGSPGGPVERFIEGRFPSSIRFGENCHLEVRISVQASSGEHVSPLKSGVLPEGKSAEVLLLLHAPDFKILENGSRERTLSVPPSGNSEFAMWPIQALRPGAFELSVTAYYGSVGLGELTIHTTVDPTANTGPSETHSADASFKTGDAAEVTLEIRYDKSLNVYRCTFITAGFHSDDLGNYALDKPLPRVHT